MAPAHAYPVHSESSPTPASQPAAKSPHSWAALAPPLSRLRALADFHSQDLKALNVLPTLALCVPMFLVFAGLATFLELQILSKPSAFFGIFFVGSYVVFSTYFVANHFMQKLSSSYAAIAEDRKFYVLSNLIKSAVLLAYSPSAAVTLWNACFYDDWNTPRIRAMGTLYAIPDAVSMLLVSRMSFSTKVHHLCVVIFMVVNLFVDYEQETIGRALVVYATFSTFAYLVNLLLASRFLPISPAVSFILSFLALVIYAGCLGINWTWQLGFLYKLAHSGPSWIHVFFITVYVGLISMVVYDDVVLTQWLWKNVHKTAAACSPRSPKKPK